MKRTALARSTKPMPRKRAVPRKKAKRAPTASQLRKQATTLWGRLIHARDIRCQYCGRENSKLDAHHLVRREFNATRTDENNGVLICAFPCHQSVMHGDPFAAVQFYTRLLGVEGYAQLRQKAYDGQNQRYPVDFWKAEIARLTTALAAVGIPEESEK